MAKKKAIVADPKLVAEHEKEWIDAKPAEIRPLYETARAEANNNPVILYTDPDAEYERLYSWIHKGDVDSTLKAILKELVRIRMGGGHV